jgi:hypothetical protein
MSGIISERFMRAARILTIVVTASVAVTVAAQQRAAERSAPGKPLAMVGGTLIDGTGRAPLRNSVVLIRGDRIEKISGFTNWAWTR